MFSFHTTQLEERWKKFSFVEQMGNVGSEVHRALLWREKDKNIFQNSIYRALELLDFTIRADTRREGIRELTRVREFLCGILLGEKNYGITLEILDDYFFQFALAAKLRTPQKPYESR